MSTMTQDLAHRLAAIKATRERHGITQAQLAEAADVAESTIQNLEGARAYKKDPHSLAEVEAALERLTTVPPEEDRDNAAAVAAPLDGVHPIQRPAGMPLRVQRELTAGEVIDTEVIDLSDGGMKLVIVVTRDVDAGKEAADDDRMRRDLVEWSRIQRKLRGMTAGTDGDGLADAE